MDITVQFQTVAKFSLSNFGLTEAVFRILGKYTVHLILHSFPKKKRKLVFKFLIDCVTQ